MAPYIGQIIPVGFSFAPAGWAICDGSLLAIGSYETLFSLIGTTYGGDGSTTFALPDLRGRTPVGSGVSTLGADYVLGQVGGVEQVSITLFNYPSHSHLLYATGAAADTASPAGAVLGGGETIYASNPVLDGSLNAAVCGPSPGLAGPHENRQPYLTLNWIIALEGIYPPQN